MMSGHGKSDKSVVPMKLTNNPGAQTAPEAESVEGRGLAKGNPQKQNRPRAQYRNRLQQALERIRKVVSRDRRSYPELRLGVIT